MSRRPIIDAGPSLNFFSVNQERLLINVLGKLSAPETVQDEVLRKSQQDPRFRAAEVVWRKLTPTGWLLLLSDDETPALAAVVSRMTQLPMAQAMRNRRDLGETMVIAHAVVAAETGDRVTVLIDDGKGAQLASLEIDRLNRMRAAGRPVGSIELASTATVLERAAQRSLIPDKQSMRAIYGRLRDLDDGLLPIERTRLLASSLWSNR
jgi:hypothetical protein